VAVLTPSDLRSSCDQLPFIVSQIPYSNANTPNSQNPGGMPLPACCRCSGAAGLSGRRRLTAMSAASMTAASSGSPTQNPMPVNAATKAGASAVPRPSSAFKTRTALSLLAGWKAATSVFSDGTVRPKPAPRQPVATSSSA
jgi:hypothetical protein